MSWFNYANEALLVNQWSNVTDIKCETEFSLCFLTGQNIIDYLHAKEVIQISKFRSQT
jgi:hypothetical protein